MRKNGCIPDYIIGLSWNSTDSNLSKLFKGDSLVLSGTNFWASIGEDLSSSSKTTYHKSYDVPDSYLGGCITYSSSDPYNFILKESSERTSISSNFFDNTSIYGGRNASFDRSFTSSTFSSPLRCSADPNFFTTLDYQPPYWALFTAVFEGFPVTVDEGSSSETYPKAPFCKIYANKTLVGTIECTDLFNDNLATYYSSDKFEFDPTATVDLTLWLGKLPNSTAEETISSGAYSGDYSNFKKYSGNFLEISRGTSCYLPVGPLDKGNSPSVSRLRIFNKSLSPKDVAFIYREGMTLKDPNGALIEEVEMISNRDQSSYIPTDYSHGSWIWICPHLKFNSLPYNEYCTFYGSGSADNAVDTFSYGVDAPLWTTRKELNVDLGGIRGAALNPVDPTYSIDEHARGVYPYTKRDSDYFLSAATSIGPCHPFTTQLRYDMICSPNVYRIDSQEDAQHFNNIQFFTPLINGVSLIEEAKNPFSSYEISTIETLVIPQNTVVVPYGASYEVSIDFYIDSFSSTESITQFLPNISFEGGFTDGASRSSGNYSSKWEYFQVQGISDPTTGKGFPLSGDSSSPQIWFNESFEEGGYLTVGNWYRIKWGSSNYLYSIDNLGNNQGLVPQDVLSFKDISLNSLAVGSMKICNMKIYCLEDTMRELEIFHYRRQFSNAGNSECST